MLGTLGGGAVAISGASVTYATGEVFVQHFESGGTLLDFDVEKAKSQFKKALKKGEAAVKAAVETPAAETAEEVATDSTEDSST